MSDKKTIRDRVVDPGYRLPATIEPGEDVCIRVYVPKDSLYLAAFWSQYERLGMWLAWERGSTRAKDAASAWKVRIAKAREINDCAEGDCGIMDVRTKPNYPCVLQKWDDCTASWVDFADTRLCVPMMRINGLGELEQWNGTEWVSAKPDEGAGGTYEPGHDLSNQIAHYDPPPVGQDGKCLAAANAVTYLQAAIDASMTELKELPYLVRLLDSILTTWYWRVYNFAAFTASMVTGLIWSLSWEDAHKLMSDKSLTNEDDIIAVDITEDVLCLFYAAYESDGTMGENTHTALLGQIQNLIDAETPNTPKCMKLEWLMLLSFPGPTWMANISNNAGIDEYDCFVCSGWEQVWNATNGWGDWYIVPGELGEIEGGTLKSTSAAGYTSLIARTNILAEMATVTRVEMTYNVISTPPWGQNRLRMDSGGGLIQWYLFDKNAGTGKVFYVDGLWDFLQLEVDWETGGHTIEVTEIIMRGTGENPFA